MAADPVVARELKSLQGELSTVQRDRRKLSAEESVGQHPVMAPGSGGTQNAEARTAATPGGLEETTEAKELRGELRDLVKELADFVQDAEANISAHPAVSMVAAMLLGILIGSLLARR
jgi:ElaB/YqjD/DUF883 family membrane-anchored ribosome-binding protein